MTIATSRTWTFTLLGKPLRQNAERRGSWGKNAEQLRKLRAMRFAIQHEREEWQQRTGRAVKALSIPHLQKIRISAVYYRKVTGRADQQNDIGALKDIIDGIVRAGVVDDDRYEFVEMGQVSEAKGDARVEITIEELTDG